MEDIEVREEELLSDANGNYAYLTFGGYLYTPFFLEMIDRNRCQNCERCLQMCDTRGVDENGNVVPAFPEICNGCGHCVNICRSQGIKARPIPLEEMIERVRARKRRS